MSKSQKFSLPPSELSLKEVAEAAAAARLRYVTDTEPGITRRCSGSGFIYVDSQGRRLKDAATLARIRSLVIPPAWTQVWITTVPHGHLQATGRDARGRKQYKYHPRWREVRDETKYGRMAEFGAVLPRIRARVRRDLKLPGLPREKVLATVVRLMDMTHLRIGNEEYARTNGSFGLTTLRDRHVEVRGDKLKLSFRGKSGVFQQVDVRDPRLAHIVKRCRDLPGQELFQYVDEQGKRHGISSADVNDYLREIAGEDFTAKDFRTWAGTLLAARAVAALDPPQSQRAAKAALVSVVKTVAERLGNTVAVCRKCYIHPLVLESYGNAEWTALLRVSSMRRTGEQVTRSEEQMVLRFLRKAGKTRLVARTTSRARRTAGPTALAKAG